MKVIDLLVKMASGELEDLTHIRNIQHDCEYIYHKKDCRFEFVKKGIWEDYFYKFDISELNDEIEIIEEPKEELEEIEELDNRVAFKTTDLESGIEKEYKWDFTDVIQNTKINELIANQNKIIRELKDNKENE